MEYKKIVEKIIYKILSWYKGKKVLTYEQDRNNKKWQFEQLFVENFLRKNLDVTSVIDVPIGTNRFGKIIDQCPNIQSFIGIDLSDDMLNFAKLKNDKKLVLKKKDIINEKCEDRADLIIILRMLNLFETKISLKIIENLLSLSKKYCIATLRHDQKHYVIENKIHVQPIEEFKEKIISLGYNYKIYNFEDNRKGTFSILLIEKNK